jgi:hypothetical protein
MKNYNEARQAASYRIQEALVARDVLRNEPEALRLFELAYEAEKQAAFFLLTQFETEPARSVTFRSAASLALNCKKYEEAKKMVHFGLAGNPPAGIAKELMEVYELIQQAMKLEEIPAPALGTAHNNQKSKHYFWLKGILTVADAKQHQIRIVSDDNKIAKVHFPKDLGEIVRNYWNEYVNAYILKQGKVLTLVEIDKIFMQKTA